MVTKAFQVKLNNQIRCNGCGRIIGPDVGRHLAYQIREDPVGTYCTRWCWEAQREAKYGKQELSTD